MHSMRRERQGPATANAKGILRISITRAQSYTGVQEMWTSFVSEKFAVTLVEEGFELGATQRQIRLADGRSSGVTEQVEVQIGLGNRQVDLALLVLPGVIDELVLGWDFLSTMGTILECAGIQVRIPARRRHSKEQRERLSVANTLEQKAQKQLTQEPGSREHGTPQQENQEQRIQEQAITGKQIKAEEEENTDNGETSGEPLHSDAAIDQFLRQEITTFASMTRTSPITEHRIVLHDDRPIKQRYFQKNPKMQEEINNQIDELLAKGCIKPSNSPHSAPIVMVKKTGKWRLGLFQWKVMPLGLHSAPATFQRALDRVIGPEMLPHTFAYLDDIIVIGKTLEEHKNNELKYLGHKVTEHGIGTDPEKVAAISQLKPPTNVKGLRQYLGVASWYRRFVPDFANTVSVWADY
ncbi:hypothetical protein ACLKA6_018954 [Drosophila palustris]